MINLHVEYKGKALGYDLASQMALTKARASAMRQPAIVSWHQHSSRGFSPSFEGAEEQSWWAKYGVANGGRMAVSVGDDFEFILTETGGYETLQGMPLRNLKDESGNEFVCLSPMLDDTNRPRKDACVPLDDWMADQY